MISLLVVSQEKENRETYALDFCKKLSIDPFDISLFQPQTSLGIEDVREIQKKVFLKPFKSKEKAIIIGDAHSATIEAQNALLKLLEEPPMNTYVILTASSTRQFLATILSRCKIVMLDGASSKKFKEQEAAIDSLITGSISEKLVFAQELAKNK